MPVIRDAPYLSASERISTDITPPRLPAESGADLPPPVGGGMKLAYFTYLVETQNFASLHFFTACS
ncbi:MAG: hypothetical protein AAB731_04060 [Patescibacteria group bacterium]